MSKLERLEELANSVTHGLGLLLSLAGLALLVTGAVLRGTVWHVVSCAIYGATLVLLYGASTLYHSCRQEKIKKIFRLFDHCAIYLLIAGTYTPFLLVNLRAAGKWVWFLFAFIWMLAMGGIVLKGLFFDRLPVFSTVLYVLMGWTAIVIIKPLLTHLSLHSVLWLIGGGIFYTSGIFFFASERLRLSHTIWHVFVMLGSACHFCAVYFYVLPGR
jgi:hemolysin III